MVGRTANAMPSRVVVLARDPAVIAAAREAARRVRRSSAVIDSGKQALALLTAPGRTGHQLICDRNVSEAACWPDIVAAAAEQRGPTPLLVVSNDPAPELPAGMRAIPTDSAKLARALSAREALRRSPAPNVTALRAALGRGEIAVRYQPMVRVCDRRPMMVEALVRFAPGYPPVGPDRFLPLVARSGLMRPLSIAVARAAVRDIAPARHLLSAGITLNLPLDLLRQPDLTSWLGRVVGRSALRREDLAIELTEHAAIHDPSSLRRALVRLREAGHRVFLDDIVLDDPRAHLLDLPFSGLKLDRGVVTALPHSARARHFARTLARQATARGQVTVAEGVSHPVQLRLLNDIGIDWAQGFLISRPLPANALRAWSELWRAGRPL
jgi:EAL domain-containing protein (putative c-di-GMP-specific phosphodiesterase class I)